MQFHELGYYWNAGANYIYGDDNVRMSIDTAERLKRIFLERVNGSEFDLGDLDVEDFEHEPWYRYVESLGCRMIGEGKWEEEIYNGVCRWDGERPLPAEKDDYDHFLVSNPNIGDPYILVPKDIAIKILTLGVP